jgi:hypothetical protein
MARIFMRTMALCLLASTSPVWAEANPSLTARVNGVNSAATQSSALRIGTMDVAVKLRGSIAETSITVRFENPSGATLEGEFNLDMPKGSVVTGYALDIGGVMIDGVLVPPHQAQIAYEQRVERRVDPGIAEVTHGSRFSTRVFPIFPGNGRTIRLTFTTPLDPELGYVLPLDTAGKVGKMNVTITAANQPSLSLPTGLLGKWGEAGYSYSGKDVALSGTLSMKPATGAPAVTLSEHRSEGRFFEINDSAATDGRATKAASSVAILWDRSRSRLDHPHDREIAMLRQTLDKLKPSVIKLILFDSGGIEQISVANSAALADALAKVRYAGATSFASLERADLAGVDTCLLLSDGLATMDRRDRFSPACRLFAITSTRDADRGFLGSRARRTGGDLFDLDSMKVDDVVARLTRSGPQVVDVRAENGEPISFTALPSGRGGWRIVGRAPDQGGVIVRLAGVEKGVVERRYAMSTFATPLFDGTGALWAADQIGGGAADMAAADLLAMARRYSVASPLASFIVLETANDYAQAGIDPPASYPKDQRAQYAALKAQRDAVLANQKENRLALVLQGWSARQDWWRNPISKPQVVVPPPPPPVSMPRPQPMRPSPAPRRNARPAPLPEPPPPPPVPAPMPTMEVPPSAPPPPPAEAAVGNDIVVTSVRRDSANQDVPIAVTAAPGETRRNRRQDRDGVASAADSAGYLGTEGASAGQPSAQLKSGIEVRPWSSDRPYIAALDAAKGDKLAVVAAQEKKYGSLPAFYLDMGEWFAAQGNKPEAARMAAAALELPTRNNDTLAIVAARLMRYGEVDRAIWLLEKLVEAEPERPQPRRTLALALIQRSAMLKGDAARADLARALSLLNEVIMTPWDGRFPEIETIALSEANMIIPRFKALGGTKLPLDPQLVRLLDTDIRVTVEWNTKDTDMDLWVDEPGGERVIFSHPRSSKGGHLSRDFTQGFGPEEYLMHKALPGKYVVRINTYRTDRLNPNGPTNVTARLYRNWGRADQTEQLIDLEVLPGSEGQRMIGTIEVK